MSFRFNFSSDDKIIEDKPSDNIEWLESIQVFPTYQFGSLDELASHAQMFTCDDIEIGHVIATNVLSHLSNNYHTIKAAELEHSDLIVGKYEGGLKLWECTMDLLEYFIKNKTVAFESTDVLDLGCGAGLLGIYAFMFGASVTFQDYNKEVLECITIPNVLLNIQEESNYEEGIKKCKFYSGDWSSFNEKHEAQYDIILTSETIYNINNYQKLIDVFHKRLKPGGSVYVAAKTYYFGVGGGTRQFEDALLKHGYFKYEVIWKTSEGIQREIIKLNKSS